MEDNLRRNTSLDATNVAQVCTLAIRVTFQKLWASSRTINKSENGQIVVKGSPVKIS